MEYLTYSMLCYIFDTLRKQQWGPAINDIPAKGAFQLCMCQKTKTKDEPNDEIEDDWTKTLKKSGMSLMDCTPSTPEDEGNWLEISLEGKTSVFVYYEKENTFVKHVSTVVHSFCFFAVSFIQYPKRYEVTENSNTILAPAHDDVWSKEKLVAEFMKGIIEECKGKSVTPIFGVYFNTMFTEGITDWASNSRMKPLLPDTYMIKMDFGEMTDRANEYVKILEEVHRQPPRTTCGAQDISPPKKRRNRNLNKYHVMCYNCISLNEQLRGKTIQPTVKNGGFDICLFQETKMKGDPETQEVLLSELLTKLGMDLIDFVPSIPNDEGKYPKRGNTIASNLKIKKSSFKADCIFYKEKKVYLDHVSAIASESFCLFNIYYGKHGTNHVIPEGFKVTQAPEHKGWSDGKIVAKFIQAMVDECAEKKLIPIFAGDFNMEFAEIVEEATDLNLNLYDGLHDSLTNTYKKASTDDELRMIDHVITLEEYKHFICCHEPVPPSNKEGHAYLPFDILIHGTNSGGLMCKDKKCVFTCVSRRQEKQAEIDSK